MQKECVDDQSPSSELNPGVSPAATPRPGVRDVAPYVSPQLEVAARLNTIEDALNARPEIERAVLTLIPPGDTTSRRAADSAH